MTVLAKMGKFDLIYYGCNLIYTIGKTKIGLISVGYLIFKKLVKFHKDKNGLSMQRPDSTWASRLAFHFVAD